MKWEGGKQGGRDEERGEGGGWLRTLPTEAQLLQTTNENAADDVRL